MTSPAIDQNTLAEMRSIQAELRQLSTRLDALIDNATGPTAAPEIPAVPPPDQDPWLKALYEWADNATPLPYQIDDSRDSIYEDALRGRY